MTGVKGKMKKSNEEITTIVSNLLDIFNQQTLTTLDMVRVVSTLLFSIGVSLEGCGEMSSEKILTRYATKPTLGSALMAQAKHMSETWTSEERKESDDGTE